MGNMLPEVEHCCGCVSLRVGMLYMSVLAIMTGSLTLSMIEKNSDFLKYAVPYKYINRSDYNVSWAMAVYLVHNRDVKASEQEKVVEEKMLMLLTILSVLCYMTISCMLLGVVLLVATLMGEQCLVYVFIVGMFLLVILALLLAGVVIYECLYQEFEEPTHICLWYEDACLVRSMDWLTGSACIVFCIMYLFVWIYFIIVANSFAVNGDTD